MSIFKRKPLTSPVPPNLNPVLFDPTTPRPLIAACPSLTGNGVNYDTLIMQDDRSSWATTGTSDLQYVHYTSSRYGAQNPLRSLGSGYPLGPSTTSSIDHSNYLYERNHVDGAASLMQFKPIPVPSSRQRGVRPPGK
jgi:hypothetical protein